MQIIKFVLLMMAVAPPTVKISPLLLIRVTSVSLLYVAVLSISFCYSQAIGLDLGTLNGLFQVTAITQVIDCFIYYPLWESLDTSWLNDLQLSKSFIASSLLYKVSGNTKSGKAVKSVIELTSLQKDIIIGTMLGDAHLEQSPTKRSARLILDQTFPGHAFYLTILYVHLQQLFGTAPRVITRKADKRTGVCYSSIRCATLQHTCFSEFYELFYKERRKVVPYNIGDLLTARALAYWIMDDGAKGSRGETILHTESFTLEEVHLLQEALRANFSLRTRLIEKRPDQWLIVVPLRNQSIPLRHIVSQHMCVSMMHKI